MSAAVARPLEIDTPDAPDADDRLTVGQVARMADRTPSTVQYWDRRGLLVGERIAGMNGARLYRRSVVEAFLEKRRRGAR